MLRTYAIALVGMLLTFGNLYAQEEAPQSAGEQINTQFNTLLEESNNYQDYKVVKQIKLEQLQQQTLTLIKDLEARIEEAQDTITAKQQRVNALKESLQTTKADLENVNQEKNDISFLGMATNKTTYQTTMWLVILVLVLILMFFVYKFKSSNSQTKEAKKRLQSTEDEFDDFRKKALEKQQKLGRMLQDEKNKAARG